MNIVHRVFEQPLREKRAISKEEIQAIFVNWKEIIECNRKFLGDLLDRRDNCSQNIGDVICNHVGIFFKKYAVVFICILFILLIFILNLSYGFLLTYFRKCVKNSEIIKIQFLVGFRKKKL